LLTDRLGAIRAFAFPFGATDERARTAVAALGCTVAAEIGLASGTANGMRLGRVPVAGQSPAELFADLEVTEPLKAALRALARHLR
jgi:hypothetical protein